jgi:hypothetical protein
MRAEFEAALASGGFCLLRPARHGELARPGARFLRPLRQVIESVNATFKGHLDLERRRGHTPAGVITRVMQRVLALAAAIWRTSTFPQPHPVTTLHSLRETPCRVPT